MFVTPLIGRFSASTLYYCFILIFFVLSPASDAADLAKPTTSLTLAQAAERVLQQHPQLQVFDWRSQAAATEQDLALLKPDRTLALQAENLLGSGELSGVKRLELSVALSSVLELGNKPQARIASASAQQALVLAQRQASSLDLVGELTQQFISVLTLQHQLQLASDNLLLTEQALLQVKQRVQQGAAPDAELLRAKVAVRQAQLQQGLRQAELESSKLALASMWGAQQADFDQVSGDLWLLTDSVAFPLLYQRLLATPQLEVFAATARLQQAQLAQLQTQSVADVSWQLGIKRSQENRDIALIAGFSVPLINQQRQQGAVKIALAEQQAQRLNQQSAVLQLRARLYQAWQQHRYSSMLVRDLKREILPLLTEALAQTEQAYLLGRYSYADWLSARQALQEAQLQLLDAASTALRNQALIEQLSGLPLAENSPLPRLSQHKNMSFSSSTAKAAEGSLP